MQAVVSILGLDVGHAGGQPYEMLHRRGPDWVANALPDKGSTADDQGKLQGAVDVNSFFHLRNTPLKITRGRNSRPGLRCHYAIR